MARLPESRDDRDVTPSDVTPRDVAPRWVRTTDHDATLAPVFDDDDWLLLSDAFVVGRVTRDSASPQAGRYAWSLTGPDGAPIGNHGTTGTLDAAQAELMAAWRRRQMWAECGT